MTPVDAESTADAGMPSASAIAAHTVSTSRSPCGPVSALALPLLTTIACTVVDGTRVAAWLTGAARDAFTVKQPAATHGTSLNTSAMSLRDALMPALTPAYENPRGVFTTPPRGATGP